VETLTLLEMDKPNESQAKLLADEMENLMGVFGNVCSGLGEKKH
jgi:hypothetical protein